MHAVSLCSWEMGLLVGMEGPGEGSKRLSLGWGHLGQGRCISQGLKGVKSLLWGVLTILVFGCAICFLLLFSLFLFVCLGFYYLLLSNHLRTFFKNKFYFYNNVRKVLC